MARRFAGLLRLSASSVSARVHPLLQNRTGTVLATFMRSCYLELGGQVVAVVASELLDGPLNLVVSVPADVTLHEIGVGETLTARDGSVLIAGRWHVDATAARIWNPRISPLPAGTTLGAQIAFVRSIVEDEAPVESVARHERRAPRVSEAMSALADGLRGAAAAKVAGAARRLAGLGPGLTPSGDDVLAGTLLALAAVRPEQAGPLREAIVSAAPRRTTRISGAHLEAAAAGEAGQAWHRLLRALHGDPQELRGAVQRVLAFGETSGADMLAGFVLAMDALLPA